jgi:preprotein translocase subunit SecA
VRVQTAEQVEQAAEAETSQPHVQNVQYHHSDYDEALGDANAPAQQPAQPPAQQPVRNYMPKVGRNDPCPCGSGKKFNHCHGKLA